MLPVASRFVLRPRFFIFLPLPSSSLTWEWWGIQVLLRLASESLFRSISYQIWSSFPSDRASSTPFIDGRPKAQSVHWFIGVASFWQGFFSHFFHRYSSLLWLNEVARTIVYIRPQSEPLILPQRNVARLGKNMKTPCFVFTSIYTRQCEPCRPCQNKTVSSQPSHLGMNTLA